MLLEAPMQLGRAGHFKARGARSAQPNELSSPRPATLRRVRGLQRCVCVIRDGYPLSVRHGVAVRLQGPDLLQMQGQARRRIAGNVRGQRETPWRRGMTLREPMAFA